ncbi:MAG: JDVT-CTERM system glutamic-type intramembrane protease [Pseudomonadota bacterium]|nr:JDVT-CTERM system glutamic-type intramembrane protease [Pseudomonadota bacterium]
MNRSFWQDNLALSIKKRFWLDVRFYAALILAPIVLMLGFLLYPDVLPSLTVTWSVFFIMVVWQPIIEELFFRGFLHGQFNQNRFFSKSFFGLTITNLVVSSVFVLAHMFVQPFGWALAVFFPSLIFGWFRDQFDSVFPSIILHSFYNGVFLLFVSSVDF